MHWNIVLDWKGFNYLLKVSSCILMFGLTDVWPSTINAGALLLSIIINHLYLGNEAKISK